MAKKKKAKKPERTRERLDPTKPVGLAATAPGTHGLDGDLPPTPEKYGARPSKATTCKSCGHAYIDPCDDSERRKAKCGNWNWLLANKKVKKK